MTAHHQPNGECYDGNERRQEDRRAQQPLTAWSASAEKIVDRLPPFIWPKGFSETQKQEYADRYASAGRDYFTGAELSKPAAQPLTAGQAVPEVDLYAEIMNLPCRLPNHNGLPYDFDSAYRIGHRDARHAAAELVSAAEAAAPVAQPAAQDERERVLEEVAQWLLNNYQDYATVADIVAAIRALPTSAANPRQEAQPAVQAVTMPDAMPLLKRLKRDLMGARRFQADTLDTYRRAYASAEVDIEEYFNECRAVLAAPSQQPAASPTEAK